MKRNKIIITASSAILFLIIVLIFVFQGVQNSAIGIEESIDKSTSNIKVEVKRKNLLFQELIAGIKSYNRHEANTLKEVIKARQTNSLNDQKKAVNILVERYPELKANTNYKNMLTEFATTENRIANQQQVFNQKINEYNKFVRVFPNKQVLSIVGYQVKKYKYLEFESKLTEENLDSISGL